ncbi:Uncharacterised protein [Bergeriella denitrificans]|uniref:Uncharacterized protein n=1 Tax=Bergeriella denitrificans TaxID=494 RepID=A0A378UEQ9_BERDE|nr:Uncharacterised protein [Bergeriella denitrificans]
MRKTAIIVGELKSRYSVGRALQQNERTGYI